MDTNPYYMDYKKIYELFFGVTDRITTMPGSDEDTTNSDQEMVDGILQKRKIDDAWYTVPFTLLAGGHFKVGDKHYTKRSGLNFYELLITISGHGIVETSSKTFNCIASTVLLLDCNDKHFFHVRKGEDWEYKHIHFIANGVAKNVAERAKLNMVYDDGSMDTYVRDLFMEYRHIHTDSHFILSNCISSILTSIIRQDFKNSFTDPQEEMVKSAAKYMRGHYGEKISVQDLAEKQFISTYYFVRLFRKYYGIPPYNYLMNYRLKQSQYMLMSQNAVKDIVQKCGFTSTNSFARAFKRQFGVSPSMYREKIGIRQIDPSIGFTADDKSQERIDINEK